MKIFLKESNNKLINIKIKFVSLYYENENHIY